MAELSVFEKYKDKPLVILTGPTAVGKTDLSLKLAKEIGAEIISADSMQVYKMMDVGTAKILPHEMQGVRHHLIDYLEPDQDLNVADFKEKVFETIDQIYSRGHIPMIVGGTGFYIQAILYCIDLDDDSPANDKLRSELMKYASEYGNEALHEKLKLIDQKAAQSIHPNNLKRVIRAIEYYETTGKLISEHNEEQSQHQSPFNYSYFVLDMLREELYKRINLRVNLMRKNGLTEEFERVYAKYPRRDSTAMQAIGYKEFFPYLDGEMSLDEVYEQIKQDSRHLAKRQLTWFRRERDVTWLELDQFDNDRDKVFKYIIECLEKKGIYDGN